MIIDNKIVITYDIEVFRNCFHCCCKNTETNTIHLFELSNRKSQLEELVGFFILNKNYLFCGYNNKHYDDIIINYIIDYYRTLLHLSSYNICKSIYNLSNIIIKSEENDTTRIKKWKYANFFNSFDLLSMMFSSKLRVGLKEMQTTMHYKNVQEFCGGFGYLNEKDFEEMISYNINDVESTTELLYRLKDEINIRLFIKEEYGINALSMDSVKFGETILAKKYCEATGINMEDLKKMSSPMDYIKLKDVILPQIKYKSEILNNLLEDMKSSTVYTKERKGFERQFILDGVCYSVGVGGIHSLNKPKIYKPKEDEYIGHSDVTSMYPSFIIQYKWIPRHLGIWFYNIYCNIYKERVAAKHNGQKSKDKTLKLTLNSVTGKMQQETSWMYDPLTVFKIRINGQLVLLMLVDKLISLGCKIVQVNTDGVVYVAKNAQKEQILHAITEVENLSKLKFESDEYEAFYQYAVNDYFGICKGYFETRDKNLIETKGMFITDTVLGKGLSPTIIPKAVINYFITKQPVNDYVHQCNDIRDFLMAQKVNKKFIVEYNGEPIQRINRYYASTDGCYLYKVSLENGERKYVNMLTKSGVTILNKLDNIETANKKINYQYYISEINKIIEAFTCQQLSLFE